MMFPPELRCSSFVIIVDNAHAPTKGLLQRIRNREMMELSASRWNATPAANTTTQSSPASLDEPTTPTNLGPKVPLRQISPPVQKRDSTQQPKLAAPATLPPSPSGSPSSESRKGIPNKPVRSKSPRMQQRDSSSSSFETDSKPAATLPMSPMLPGRHHRANHGHSTDTALSQERPRMPQRKRSLLKQEHKDEEAAIGRLLTADEEDDEEEDEEDTQNMDASIVLTALEQQDKGRHALTRRPSQLARQSSFEILPATLPTRQSSFELRHRGASPLSEKVVMEILHHRHHPRPLSPERSQSSASMPNLSRRDTPEDLAAQVEPKLHVSLPNLYLSTTTGLSDSQETGKPRRCAPRLKAASAGDLDSERHARLKTEATMAKPTGFDKEEVTTADHPTAQRIVPSSKVSAGSSVLLTKNQQLQGPPVTTPMPRKPMRQWSFNSQSSESSAGSCKARRFPIFRPGATRPSLPVRNSSFDFTVEHAKSAPPVGKLPGRQSSFPGLHSTFQKL
ncbi:expressed unknown protein [Seminavis robusta]|uniref:Uncharacterized protein n=1 Tax=Seminavis robusta TaxID=568900 RepID=A0A9N8DPG7_9STRA|nr:expressed unknown protein [Seminavis robusta]|eukprot:Sro261_g101870.1 n/a (507) ;mRNA; f:71727-73247